ncbi:MAG TPA: RMD1 family protein [Caulobacteraceae bacterium]|jgi:uncharacterized Rmd1/YagE family protein|nr:RMD1 family protein [Caulobacteraceae bacterium]
MPHSTASPPRAEDAPAPPLRAHALLLGDRIGTSGLEHDGVVATAPLSFKSGKVGLAALFRYGAAVLIGLSDAEEAEVLAAVSDRVVGREPAPEEETARIVVRPGQEEQITPAGAIQLRDAGADHLLIVADALAKSVALARDERRLAAVFDAIEPFAASLATGGRAPGGRQAIVRLIGQALLVQHRLSGRVAVREKPDILWDRPDLERLYGRLEDEYELIERAETLDRKLAVIAATATALVDLQDTARFLRLEILVVILILAELALGFIQLGLGRL